ncbi:hypothetical protein HDU76_005739 [Blyttiomyces sp. JEL0837]|nr:hypothetical protein HDU76_005739 [Blyttiomyces sp. JEL0837]
MTFPPIAATPRRQPSVTSAAPLVFPANIGKDGRQRSCKDAKDSRRPSQDTTALSMDQIVRYLNKIAAQAQKAKKQQTQEQPKIKRSPLPAVRKISVKRIFPLTEVPGHESTKKTTALEMWSQALRKIVIMLRTTNAITGVVKSTDDSDNIDIRERQTMAANIIGFNIEDYRARKHSLLWALSADMRNALLKASEEKTNHEIELLGRLISSMPAFAKYDHSVRRALAKVIGYGSFGPGRIIVRQICLVSGQVEVHKVIENESYGLSTLEAGDSFGELALLHNVKRSASIVTKVETELLWVNKEDFLDVLKQEELRDLEEKQQFLSSIPFFAEMSPQAIKHIALTSQSREVLPNNVLFAEGDVTGFIYLLREGSCRIVKHVAMAEIPLSWTGKEKVLVPYPFQGDFNPPFGFTLSHRFLKLMDIGPGFHYGEACAIAAMGTSLQASALGLDIQNALRSQFSVISNTRARCLLLSRIDFAKVCTLELAAKAGAKWTEDQCTLLDQKMLQQLFLSNRQWSLFKKKCVSSVVTKKNREAQKLPLIPTC